MKYTIIISPEAEEDIENIPVFYARQITDAIEKHLTYQPTRLVRSEE